MEKKIYLVSSYSVYDDDIDIVECAFDSEEKANAYVKDKEEKINSISDELYDNISNAIEEEEEKIESKYYEPYEYTELLEGASEEEYDKEMGEWEENGKEKFVEDNFHVSYEAFLLKEEKLYGKGNYMVNETILYS